VRVTKIILAPGDPILCSYLPVAVLNETLSHDKKRYVDMLAFEDNTYSCHTRMSFSIALERCPNTEIRRLTEMTDRSLNV